MTRFSAPHGLELTHSDAATASPCSATASEVRVDVTRRTVFDRETYVRANTAGTHDWHGQRLDDPQVVVIGGTADDGRRAAEHL
jgi:hypothetical protein